MRRQLILVLVYLLALGNVQAQQQQPVTFTSNTTLVIIDVNVKDKSGKVIEDLKKDDFKLTEDGKTQQISVFDFQKLRAKIVADFLIEPAVVKVISDGIIAGLQYESVLL